MLLSISFTIHYRDFYICIYLCAWKFIAFHSSVQSGKNARGRAQRFKGVKILLEIRIATDATATTAAAVAMVTAMVVVASRAVANSNVQFTQR